VVRGRIDAVFEIDGEDWVVDWKTGASRGADPLQLALYRAAWARQQGIDPTSVVACFVFLAERRYAVYRSLPDLAGLQRIAAGATVALEPSAVLAWEV
jgi:DNA helicase-2/ATP-dependent DNA helicase PcrA